MAREVANDNARALRSPPICWRWRSAPPRIGAVAIGALAIGRIAIGRLAIKKARIGSLEVDELTVRKLRVVERQTPSA